MEIIKDMKDMGKDMGHAKYLTKLIYYAMVYLKEKLLCLV